MTTTLEKSMGKGKAIIVLAVTLTLMAAVLGAVYQTGVHFGAKEAPSTQDRLDMLGDASREKMVLRDGSFTCPTPNGYFPVTTCGKNFYQCGGGTPHLMNCAAGTCFSPEINVCDFCYKCEAPQPTCTTAAKLDLVMVLDHSTSISITEYGFLLEFTKGVIGSLQIGDDKTQVGIVRFSTRSTVEFPLDEYDTVGPILEKVNTFTADGGQTSIGLAIQDAYTIGGTRANATKAIILVTDGTDNSRTPPTPTEASAAAKNDGWIIFTVGIGGGINDALMNTMASDAAHFLKTTDFNDLLNILPTLKTQICEQTVDQGTLVRDDIHCGPDYPNALGGIGQCHANGISPCCSRFGWCGNSDLHCNCDDCVDYRD